MARPVKHDGGLYKREGSKVWWIRYRDKSGIRRRESTLTEDWTEAQKSLRERLQSQQQRIEFKAPHYVRNVIRIVTETGLRIYKELTPMKKDQLDLENGTVWIPDSKTPNGVAEVPLTEIAADAFRSQLAISGPSPYLFLSEENPDGYQKTFKTVWHATLRRAGVQYFRIYDLRSTYATRLSAGGVVDEWVTQLLRQGDAKVFKKYSQMKLQMKREALAKLNRRANENGSSFGTGWAAPFFETVRGFDTRGSLLIALPCARAGAP